MGPLSDAKDFQSGIWRPQELEEHLVADGIAFEIEHGQRIAIVGDNGQGKTPLLRTLVHSLEPLAGNMKWGHNIEIGTYAQHVLLHA